MRIAVLIDEWGWAFEFFARGWKKYSRHQVEIFHYNGLSSADVGRHDAIFAMSTVVRSRTRAPLPPDKLVIGIRSQYSHEMPSGSCGCAGFVANSEAAYNMAISNGADKSKVHYIKAAIDGEIFTYIDASDKKKVGWAGNPGQVVKRTDLMASIAREYGGVEKKSDWGPPVFVPGKTRDSQVEWLRTLGCYVQTSSHEGLSQALMEAFACGIPVVATPAGDTGKLVPEEWTIPINPATDCISEANRKISMLFGDENLARQVGIQNRKKFEEEGWCWSKRAAEYDEFIEKCILK